MKTIVLTMALLCSISVAALSFYAERSKPKQSDALVSSIESLTQEESSTKCKWKVIDCPKLFTGDYEVCVVNGDGYACTCGSVTRDC